MANQIGDDHTTRDKQFRGNVAPQERGRGIAVQQDYRIPAAFIDVRNFSAVNVYTLLLVRRGFRQHREFLLVVRL